MLLCTNIIIHYRVIILLSLFVIQPSNYLNVLANTHCKQYRGSLFGLGLFDSQNALSSNCTDILNHAAG